MASLCKAFQPFLPSVVACTLYGVSGCLQAIPFVGGNLLDKVYAVTAACFSVLGMMTAIAILFQPRQGKVKPWYAKPMQLVFAFANFFLFLTICAVFFFLFFSKVPFYLFGSGGIMFTWAMCVLALLIHTDVIAPIKTRLFRYIDSELYLNCLLLLRYAILFLTPISAPSLVSLAWSSTPRLP
ncbi:hypothetical protein [Candidatus Similichlamydia laticola]|uniref:Uncharacterized protein n=1 Tax=Candidatus Similichlamydia laticola TaxID=2170265 RepID=A0A369KKZ9_9BACT|nr:hypothetical protein [Candidatus Similichlamydia laticola]RDB31686.1 hypothetical protein HAT2_00195 [Candidatus Similichlamydia laticola]